MLLILFGPIALENGSMNNSYPTLKQRPDNEERLFLDRRMSAFISGHKSHHPYHVCHFWLNHDIRIGNEEASYSLFHTPWGIQIQG